MASFMRRLFAELSVIFLRFRDTTTIRVITDTMETATIFMTWNCLPALDNKSYLPHMVALDVSFRRNSGVTEVEFLDGILWLCFCQRDDTLRSKKVALYVSVYLI